MKRRNSMKCGSRLFFTILSLTIGLGCASPSPVAKNYPLTTQYKVQASHHWDVIADDVASQTLSSIETKDFLKGRPLFVQTPHKDIPFQLGFQNFMITHLVNRGIPVSHNSRGAVEVSYVTQVVQHADYKGTYVPGALTALTGGVMVARSLAVSSPSPWVAGGVGLGGAMLLDVAAGNAASPTHTELIVTTSITDNGIYVMRKSDVYYVDDLDVGLFAPTEKGRDIGVVGK